MALSKDTLAEIGQLALKMRQHPETKRDFAKMAKKVVPSLNFPDVDQEDRLQAKIDQFEEKQTKREHERERDEIKTRLDTEKAELAGRFKPEEIEKIEKLMLARGIASYSDAAIIFAHENPPAPAPMGQRQASFELPTNKDWLTNPKKMALNTAYAEIDQLMRKRQSA